jgi:hypothetical protein
MYTHFVSPFHYYLCEVSLSIILPPTYLCLWIWSESFIDKSI